MWCRVLHMFETTQLFEHEYIQTNPFSALDTRSTVCPKLPPFETRKASSALAKMGSVATSGRDALQIVSLSLRLWPLHKATTFAAWF